MLVELRHHGLTFLEIGAQSFAPKALQAASREHGPEATKAACAVARSLRLPFVLHLMAGLPGMTRADFRRDVETSLALGAAGLRLHPCLVLEDTALARQWRAGGYTPLTLEATLPLLAWALNRCWAAGTPVLRMGLAQEDALGAAILAGPHHPALGQRAASLALYCHIRQRLAAAGGRATRLYIPRRWQSEAQGWKGEMASRWSRLGLQTHVWDEPGFRLC